MKRKGTLTKVLFVALAALFVLSCNFLMGGTAAPASTNPPAPTNTVASEPTNTHVPAPTATPLPPTPAKLGR